MTYYDLGAYTRPITAALPIIKEGRVDAQGL